MRFITFITDFIFNLTRDQRDSLINIQVVDNARNSDFRTWNIITIVLPFLTFAVTVIFNVILSPSLCSILSNWPKFLLNGSLPIISFGIISSGVSYLMEDLNMDAPVIQTTRRRVMAIAIIFLFLTSVLYIFQSVTTVSDALRPVQNLVILIMTIVVCLFSISIGLKMYLLQRSMAVGGLQQVLNDEVNNMNDELNNFFGDEQ